MVLLSSAAPVAGANCIWLHNIREALPITVRSMAQNTSSSVCRATALAGKQRAEYRTTVDHWASVVWPVVFSVQVQSRLTLVVVVPPESNLRLRLPAVPELANWRTGDGVKNRCSRLYQASLAERRKWREKENSQHRNTSTTRAAAAGASRQHLTAASKDGLFRRCWCVCVSVHLCDTSK